MGIMNVCTNVKVLYLKQLLMTKKKRRRSPNKGSSFFANETKPIMKSTAALGAELERKGALNKRWI